MRNMRVFFFVLLCFFFVFFVKLSRGQNNRITVINVGVVTDVGIMHSDIEMLCINMSLADFYSSRPQYQTRLVVNVGDSRHDVIGAAAAGLELIKNNQVKAILGPWSSMQAHFLVEIGQKSRVPIVSYSATSPFLTSLRSPYFFRATYEDSFQVHAIKAIIKLFGWREAVPVYIDNTFGEGIMPRLTDALQEINVRIPYRSVIAPNATDHEISVELLKMMTMPTRVFIVHMYSSLALRVFIQAKEIGLMKPGYVWILTNGVTDELNWISETGIEAMEGVLGVKTYIPKSRELEIFSSQWRRRFSRMDLNVYGLWAYDAITALAIAIEEAGTNNLTFSNADPGRNVSELEALGLSQYGPKILQTLSTVQFKGLAGDFRFVNGQLQPSVFEIVNVIGTGERSVGFWTEEHGLVKQLDQQPRSMSALSTWKDHLKQIIWPGEADSVPRGWEMPTNGRKLRIGVPKRTGYTDLVKVTRDPITNASLVTGFCVDFFEAVIRAMPYDISYEFIPFEKSNGKPAGNYDDLVHQVYLGKYDAVVGDTTILANRSAYVDFTFPFFKSGVGLIAPIKDQVKRDSFTFLKPLSWRLWLISFACFFLVGITVWALEHRVNPDFRGPANYQASTILWFAFSTMVFAPRERVFSFGARLLVITWYFIVLVLTQSYTASLASLLTSQQLHPTITSMSSLLERGEKVGYQRTSFILGKLRETGFSQSSLVPFDTSEECNELLRKGPKKGGVSAAFLEIPYLRLFLGQYCNTYKMVEEPFNIDGFGFVFPIGSPMVADVSRAILKVAESPKAMELERAWFKKKEESCPDPVTNPDPNPSFTSRQLGVDSFWLLFLVVFVLCFLTLGKFTVCLLWTTKWNHLWKEFQKPDNDSYINNVEKCPCSLSRHIPVSLLWNHLWEPDNDSNINDAGERRCSSSRQMPENIIQSQATN
ncbi:PREDICTED: glutamate receptor 2.2-like [Camelina sativa]|uniref:Glutamate receptor n=1 Tax=Camelina sativa TaxID=90675 RepID=A0ABM0TPT7_CAMSA|nr:PREDICTED: glutamate receptor 2.2-like [Camelina sativa]